MQDIILSNDAVIIGFITGLIAMFGWTLKILLELTKAIERLTASIKQIEKSNEDHEKRLRAIERSRNE